MHLDQVMPRTGFHSITLMTGAPGTTGPDPCALFRLLPIGDRSHADQVASRCYRSADSSRRAEMKPQLLTFGTESFEIVPEFQLSSPIRASVGRRPGLAALRRPIRWSVLFSEQNPPFH